MDYRKIAESILENAGGERNIKSIMSCFTRVRVEVKDKSKVNEAAMKKIEGVQGINWSHDTIQVIMGGACNLTYDELAKLVHITEDVESSSSVSEKKMNVGEVIIDYVANSIQPMIPVLIAAGMVQSILAMLTYLNVDTTTYTYQVISSIGQSGYYFLPVFLGIASAKKLGLNQYLGALIGACIIYPTITEIANSGGPVNFLGIPVTLVSYTSSITPIIISMPIVAQINKIAKKISPKVLSSVIVPFVTVLVSVPVILVVTGPIATWISNGLCGVIMYIFNNLSVVGGLIIGAVAPYLVLTGVHNGIALPISITELSTFGFSKFFPLLAYGNIAIGGAALGVYLKTKNSKLKQTAMSATIMAVVGITEPALYGVCLPTKKPLISLGIMDAICSAISLVIGVKCTGLAMCGLGGLPIFFGETFVAWCILMIISFCGACAITYFLGFEDLKED